MADARRIADVLSELHVRRGYGRMQATHSAEAAWAEAVGPALVGQTRLGAVKRGVLEVIVAGSPAVQELQFQKERIVRRLQELLPDEKIRDLRCRVGPVK